MIPKSGTRFSEKIMRKTNKSMIPKSGTRFSEKGHAQNKWLERDDDSKKNHPL
jgi:hypothetical protein